MSILQGTPINTSGIHPFAQLMALGQQGIDRGIAMAGRSMEQSNSISTQFIRDAMQDRIQQERLQLQRESEKRQAAVQQAQLSMQERQMAQRSQEFAANLELRREEAGMQRQLQSRRLAHEDLKLQTEQRKLAREERMGALAEKMIGSTFGAYTPSTEENGVSGMPPSLGGDLGLPTAIDPNFVGPPVPELMGPPASLANAPQAAAPQQQQNDPLAAMNRALQMEIDGNKLAMMQDPDRAGYYYSRIGQIEGKRAELQAENAPQGGANEIFRMTDAAVIPFASLVGGSPTQESVGQYLQNASPLLKSALGQDERVFNEHLKRVQTSTGYGDVVSSQQLYDTRNALRQEQASRDRGLAEARFNAKRRFDVAGDQAVQNYVASNPYWKRIDERVAALDAVIGDGVKDWGKGPERSETINLNNQANMVENDRLALKQSQAAIDRQWDKLRTEGIPVKKESGIEIGNRKIYRFDSDGKDYSEFNEALTKYEKEKRDLEMKEKNLKGGLEILSGKNFYTGDVYQRVFGKPMPGTQAPPAPAAPVQAPAAAPSSSAPAPVAPNRYQSGGPTISRGILNAFDKTK